MFCQPSVKILSRLTHIDVTMFLNILLGKNKLKVFAKQNMHQVTTRLEEKVTRALLNLRTRSSISDLELYRPKNPLKK